MPNYAHGISHLIIAVDFYFAKQVSIRVITKKEYGNICNFSVLHSVELVYYVVFTIFLIKFRSTIRKLADNRYHDGRKNRN
jgi:hypothetical protein